jgi:deoxyhypusine monooxygenase
LRLTLTQYAVLRCAVFCRVRHEAAEALGAIAAPDCLEVLQQHTTDSCQEVAETCQLALGRLQHLQQKEATAAGAAANADAAAAADAGEEESPYYSVDPTPALPSSTPIEQLRSILLDPKQPMFEVSLAGWLAGWVRV